MIRPFQPADLDAVMSLWLEGNLDAHPFIPCAYWEGNLSAVRGLLPQAEVLVAVQSGQIQGFIGLDGDDIAGIFVARAARSAGVGSALLGEAKRRRSTLRLHVYRKTSARLRSICARTSARKAPAQTPQPARKSCAWRGSPKPYKTRLLTKTALLVITL